MRAVTVAARKGRGGRMSATGVVRPIAARFKGLRAWRTSPPRSRSRVSCHVHPAGGLVRIHLRFPDLRGWPFSVLLEPVPPTLFSRPLSGLGGFDVLLRTLSRRDRPSACATRRCHVLARMRPRMLSAEASPQRRDEVPPVRSKISQAEACGRSFRTE